MSLHNSSNQTQYYFQLNMPLSRSLNRLEQQGIIIPVSHCKWAASIVAAPKKNGKLRICWNYMCNVIFNQAQQYKNTPYQIVAAPKKNGKSRICWNYNVIVNQAEQ